MLFPRRTCEINTADQGNVPSGVLKLKLYCVIAATTKPKEITKNSGGETFIQTQEHVPFTHTHTGTKVSIDGFQYTTAIFTSLLLVGGSRVNSAEGEDRCFISTAGMERERRTESQRESHGKWVSEKT